MKNKTLIGLIATATIGSAITTPVIINNQNTAKIVNKVLMVNDRSDLSTNEAVVINGKSRMNLYALSNGTGIVSNLSTGEMLTILGQSRNGYCKVSVQETGAVGYINVANMQNILNGTNDSFTQLSGNGQVINVSSNVRFRSNPAVGNNIIGHLTNGTTLNILGRQGQWYKVSVNGQTGFIYEEYVSTNIANNSVSINSNSYRTSIINSSNSNSTRNVNVNNNTKDIIVRMKNSTSSQISSDIKSINSANSITKQNNNDKTKQQKIIKSINSSKQIPSNSSNISTSDGGGNTVKITIPYGEILNLTSTANGKQITGTLRGVNTVTVISIKNGVAYIKSNNIKGYMSNELLEKYIYNFNHHLNPNKTPPLNWDLGNISTSDGVGDTVKITIPYGEVLNLTSTANGKQITGTLRGVNTVTVISIKNGIAYIKSNNMKGYMPNELLEKYIYNFNHHLNPNKSPSLLN